MLYYSTNPALRTECSIAKKKAEIKTAYKVMKEQRREGMLRKCVRKHPKAFLRMFTWELLTMSEERLADLDRLQFSKAEFVLNTSGDGSAWTDNDWESVRPGKIHECVEQVREENARTEAHNESTGNYWTFSAELIIWL